MCVSCVSNRLLIGLLQRFRKLFVILAFYKINNVLTFQLFPKEVKSIDKIIGTHMKD